MNTRATLSYALLCLSIIAVAYAVDELRKEVNALRVHVDSHTAKLDGLTPPEKRIPKPAPAKAK